MPLPVVCIPWTKIAVDIVGKLPTTSIGYSYLLTVMDFGTRFIEAVLLKKVTAEATCQSVLVLWHATGATLK